MVTILFFFASIYRDWAQCAYIDVLAIDFIQICFVFSRDQHKKCAPTELAEAHVFYTTQINELNNVKQRPIGLTAIAPIHQHNYGHKFETHTRFPLHLIDAECTTNPFRLIKFLPIPFTLSRFQCDILDHCQSYHGAYVKCHRSLWSSNCQCKCNTTECCHRTIVNVFIIYEMDIRAVNRFVPSRGNFGSYNGRINAEWGKFLLAIRWHSRRG